MNHIGLFEGIGGFSLAARWMGWNTIAWCEWNEFGQKVLKHHFPNAKPHGDITKTDFTIYRGQCDILTGGFPCQPYSSAGKRLGKEDERHLWPEMLRAIREIQPGYVVGENVRGLTNWNGGLVFDEVQADLEAEGYEVLPFLLPACAVNAPHRRDRIWFIAYSYSNGQHRRNSQHEINTSKGREYAQCDFEQSGNNGVTTNTTGIENFGRRSGGLHTIAAGLNDERIVADTENIRCECGKECDRRNAGELDQNKPGREQANGGESCGCSEFTTNASGQGLQRRELDGSFEQNGIQYEGKIKRQSYKTASELHQTNNWQNFPTQSPVCGGNDGLPGRSHSETFYDSTDMDRDYIIKSAVDGGKIQVDFEKGIIYSCQVRGHEGKLIELLGADCNGYRVHNISFNGIKKSCRAHQIVWIAANGLYDRDKYVIDHLNRNKSDNRLCNLRLATPSQNRRNSEDYTGQFSAEDKERIASLYHDSDMSLRELAEELNISKSRVGQIIQEQKLLDGITFSKWRNESIKAYGNAIVPQVAYQIFKAIEQYENDQN